MNNDPFAPESDPDFKPVAKQPYGCETSPTQLSRRKFIITASSLTLVPVTAQADAFIPCIQDEQRIKRCHHRFCKNFGGGREYHGRL